MKMSLLDEFEWLAASVLEGDASREEVARFNDLIREYPELTQVYLEQLQMHVMLECRGGGLARPEFARMSGRARGGRAASEWKAGWRGLWKLAAAIAILVTGTILWYAADRSDTRGRLETERAPRTVPVFSAVRLMSQRNVAGLDLPESLPGVLRVESGTACVRLQTGVELTLVGPARVDVRNGLRVSLEHGQLLANVPHEATGFTVQTRELEIRDLGTVFGVRANRNASDVFVFQGRVQVNEAGSDASGQEISGTASGICESGEGVRAVAGERPAKFAARGQEAEKLLGSVRDGQALRDPVQALGIATRIADLWFERHVSASTVVVIDTVKTWAVTARQKTAQVRATASARQREKKTMNKKNTAAVLAAATLVAQAAIGGVTINGVDVGNLSGDGWTNNNGIVTLQKASATYVVAGSSNKVSLLVASNCTVVASNLTLDVSGLSGVSAFDCGTNAVTLQLWSDNNTKTNTFKGNANCAGIAVVSNAAGCASLTVTNLNAAGALAATAGAFASGIGGGASSTGGVVTINGGKVTANGGSGVDSGAGIGGGYKGAGSSLTINSGAEVTANGGGRAAGIGGGANRGGGVVTINGGTVTANGGGNGAGIGSGNAGGAAGGVTINSGTVTAKGGGFAAAIGGGYQGSAGGGVTINGGRVTATAGSGGSSGIGAAYGASAAAGTIRIGSGTVTATRSGSASDISASAAIFTGGSVLCSASTTTPAASNDTVAVYCVTVSNQAWVVNSSVVLLGLPSGFGTTDIFADSAKKVYLWLPNGTYWFLANTKSYYAEVAGAATNAVQRERPGTVIYFK